VKALFCFVNPAGKAAFDDEFLWEQIQGAISVEPDGDWTIDGLSSPTEAALVQKLSDDSWHVLHIVTVAPERDAHGAVALLSSDKRLRNLSLKYFAGLVASFPSVKLVVLHSAGGERLSFSNAARELVELGLPAVVAIPALRGRIAQLVVAALLEQLASGASPAALAEYFSALAKPAGNESVSGVEIHAGDKAAPLFPAKTKSNKRIAAESATTSASAERVSSTQGNPRIEQSEVVASEPLSQQPPAPLVGAAFLSYCRTDSSFALRLAEDLKANGADVWIDQLDIPPGAAWDRAVETALSKSPTVLVILSPSSSCSENVLDEVAYAIQKKKRVVPILYRDCDVPLRLARLQYIDFRFDYDHATKVLLYALGRAQQPAGAE
jgi:hypothetical protein